MALLTRLYCDKCHGESLILTHGDTDKARAENLPDGWKHVECDIHCKQHPNGFDLCPVCTGIDLDYYTAEPF